MEQESSQVTSPAPVAKQAAGAASWRSALRTGALLGVCVALLSALVDLVSVGLGGARVSYAALAVVAASLLALVFGAIGALLALWLHATLGSVTRSATRASSLRAWALSTLAALPLAAFGFWVPWSWLEENWESLDSRQHGLAVGVYVALFVGAVLATRLGLWFYLRVRRDYQRSRWLIRVLLGAALALALATYWADRRVLVDLYEDFHYGLATAFLLELAVALALLRSELAGFWRVRSFRREGWLWLLGFAVCALIQLKGPTGIRAPRALVFTKVVQSLVSRTDFDADGYSSLWGALDCAPFDATRHPAAFDLPHNGKDEDCTGADAHWPQAKPKAAYSIPDARGFNLLLITIDTLRADRMSLYGHTRPTTRNLERLAESAIVFDKAYAQATKTFESVPSFMTGLYPANLARNYAHRRVRRNKPFLYTLTGDTTTVSELLDKAGYSTCGAVAVDYLYSLGLDRGFDSFKTTKDVTRRGRDFLRKASSPFFLWLHYVEPHTAYVKHDNFDFGDSDFDRYDSEIAFVDSLVGKVLNELEQRQLSERTVVVVTADHGEEFFEHGGQRHAHKLYEELLHVPLLIKVPGVPARRVKDVVELVDIVPTLCEALRPVEDCERFDGQSLWATLGGQRDTGFGFDGAYAETQMFDSILQRRSLLLGDYRLILNLSMQLEELYDERADPGEQHDISATHPREVQRLREEMSLRPYRRFGPAFESAAHDSTLLVRALPRVRSPGTLKAAVELIGKHPSASSAEALARVKKRPPSARVVKAATGGD